MVDSSVVYEDPSFTVNTTPLKGEVQKLPDINGRKTYVSSFHIHPI